MKKICFNLLVLSLCFLYGKRSAAQLAQCDTMVISYVASAIDFTTSPISFGDSMITIPFINNTQTDFAYPIGRLIPITPLPTGMTHGSNGQYNVFASSWNTGDTATASFFYYLTQAIPQDYTVTFKLRVSNFSPLTYDSCEYINTLTINLNPSALAVKARVSSDPKIISVSPNPAKDLINISLDEKYSGSELMICSALGEVVFKTKVTGGIVQLNSAEFASGLYYVKLSGSPETIKLVIAN